MPPPPHDLFRVLLTHLPDGRCVSTVSLAFDHNWSGKGPPQRFETMVFEANGEGGYRKRYATRAEAERGHRHVVTLALGAVGSA